jgi:type II secretory pathway pseudopilin PulG
MDAMKFEGTRAPRGLTLVETIIGLGVAAVAVACAVPVIARTGSLSGEARSLSNLRLLNEAHTAYANTFNQRQLTFVPDEAGAYNGSCSAIVADFCPPQLILGVSQNGGIWAYYLGGGECANYPGSCGGNWSAYKPIEFSGFNSYFGSFRLGNTAAFNVFVDGRFYADEFYAPNDTFAYGTSATFRDRKLDFESTSGITLFSSYCLSPAAMWHPDVLSSAYGGFRDPNTFAAGYASPSVTQCLYPDLKTRLIEHHWCDNPPAPTFPSFGSSADPAPYLFNSSVAAAPQSLFFDGSVRRLSNQQAVADDEALFESSGQRLWSRTTPMGPAGYMPSFAADDGPRTNHTILTIDGILGRDVLAPK